MSVRVVHGDMLKVLPTLDAESIHSVITDPPYGINFMGKAWDDGVAFRPETWAEIYRVMKPGAHLAAFGGTRTYHRMACAIEDAGFEIRDTLCWLYGCLDDQTSVATQKGVRRYQETIVGDLVLCYDPSNGEYSFQPILEKIEYDYNDTAYRLIGDFGEQVVSRNHRCIIERDGAERFIFAEEAARECEVRVPVLESLPELHNSLSNIQSHSGVAEQGMHFAVHCTNDQQKSSRTEDAVGSAQGRGNSLCGMSDDGLAIQLPQQKNIADNLQLRMQRDFARSQLEDACSQRTQKLESEERNRPNTEDDWADESSVERRFDLPKPQGSVCESANQVCAVSGGIYNNVPKGRLRYGASLDSSHGNTETIIADRNGASSGSRCDAQQVNEPNAICDERSAQGIRAWSGHKIALVRVVPFHLTGKVWCLRVPTGAFVAVRGGVAFPTGNSGFPKSHDVSKGIDKAAGAVRDVVGMRVGKGGENLNKLARQGGEDADDASGCGAFGQGARQIDINIPITAPATPEAAAWQGWGTALKPAFEPILLCRKPLIGTVAGNTLKHGVGGINIDACRIEGGERPARDATARTTISQFGAMGGSLAVGTTSEGRWPANVITDGSDEVMAAFAAYGERPARDGATKGGINPNPMDWGNPRPNTASVGRNDTGTAARFFYCAKANSDDRANSKHPTVKPLALMNWLVKLLTPPGGTVLDPFAGSGTTLLAADRLCFDAIGIEQSAEYFEDINRRMRSDAPLFAVFK